MGSAGSDQCGPESREVDALGKPGQKKGYAWYGFNVLTATCSDVSLVREYKKFPNIFLYVSIALLVLLVIILATRVRGY